MALYLIIGWSLGLATANIIVTLRARHGRDRQGRQDTTDRAGP